MTINKASRFRRIAAAGAVLCLAAFLSAGCSVRLVYNLNAVADYVFRCSTWKGSLKNGKPVYAAAPDNEMDFAVSPLMKIDSDTGTMKIELLTPNGRPTLYGDKNMGDMKIYLKGDGRIDKIIGNAKPAALKDIFVVMPDKRLKKGDSWNEVRYQEEEYIRMMRDPASGQGMIVRRYFNNPVEYKFTYAGNERRDDENCARIKVEAGHKETSEIKAADGSSALVTLSLARTGDIYFSLGRGRLQEALFDQIITFLLTDPSGQIVGQENDVTRKEYKIKK